MTDEFLLRRKWTFRAHGKQVVFIKKKREQATHVLMKAFLWAMYLPDYPDLAVEIRIGDRYKPDVVQLDGLNRPVFWGEAGKVGNQKWQSLLRRYPDTHFAIAKWDTPLEQVVEAIRQLRDELGRSAPFDLMSFPADSAQRFIDERGQVWVDRNNITFVRLA